MVAPFKTNTSQAGTTQTQADQIQWKVVNLDGTHEENMAKINALTAEDEYVRIVMQTDWAYNGGGVVFGNAKYLILDLNGHKIYPTGPFCAYVYNNILEITDSSATGDGYVCGYNSYCGTFNFFGKNLILSRGSIKGFISVSNQANFIMTGGELVNWSQPVISTIYDVIPTLYLPPYIKKTEITLNDTRFDSGLNFNLTTEENTTGAGFAISTSKIISGAHNYAYGAGWDLAAGDCLLEKLTQKDTPYYLWYRDSNSEPYHFLLQLIA